MGDFLRKIQERRINSKYSVVEKIGEGGHGAVYLGRDLDSGEEVALKLEHRDQEPSILRDEADRYEVFKGILGFPQMLWYGWYDDFKVMILELLGPTLEDLLVWCGGTFTLKTTLMLADQLINRLEAFHSQGLVHRDIKPENCLLGTGENGTVVYITDLGIAIEYEPSVDVLEKTQDRQGHLIGTGRYASIKGHLGRLQSPADDLESLLYMLIYFLNGRLPWQGLKACDDEEKSRLVLEKKEAAQIEQLCSNLPKAFGQSMVKNMVYVRSLLLDHAPDYQSLRNDFREVAEVEGIEYDHVYDWIIMWDEKPSE